MSIREIVLANTMFPKELEHYYDITFPCLGLLYIASYLRKKEPGVKLHYMEGNQSINAHIKSVEDIRPDLYGIYIPTDSAKTAFEIINALKERLPKMPIICGGPHTTALPEDVLNNSQADVCVIGEGEITMSELVSFYKNGGSDLSKIKGIAFKSNGRIARTPDRALIDDIDTIPMPAWDLIDIYSYKGRQFKMAKTGMGVLASRGCPYNCTFCSNPVWKIKRPWIRTRSPKSIADEIAYIYRRGAREIYLRADELNCDMNWATRVCEEIAKLGYKDLFLNVNLRADNMSKSFAQALKDANFWLVYMGIESGNQNVLDGIGKNITLDQAVKSTETLKDAGIKIGGNFMMYNIWEQAGKICFETPEEVDNTISFVKMMYKRKLLDYIAWSITTPYPGSRLWDIALKYGIIKNERKGALQINVDLPGVSKKAMLRSRRKMQFIQFCIALRSGHVEWRHWRRIIDRLKYLIK